MKYKVGDKVRIKSLDWYNENKDDYGYVWCTEFLFTPEHSKYCGRELTISHITEFEIPSYVMESNDHDWTAEMIEGLVEEETKPKDMGEVSDGYHTFNELYEYRMLYNAALFNEFAKQGLYDVHKSRKHSDGEYPFGDSNWFIVMAELPTGQISNHYEMKDWNLFDIPEKEKANEWDGHTSKDVTERLRSFLTPKFKYPQTYEECCESVDRMWQSTEEYNAAVVCGFNAKKFCELLVCRNAYWKLAGEQMGLGKPWEPDWKNEDYKFIIQTDNNEVGYWSVVATHRILAFPTEEMRDAFYENFKELIEECKELL